MVVEEGVTSLDSEVGGWGGKMGWDGEPNGGQETDTRGVGMDVVSEEGAEANVHHGTEEGVKRGQELVKCRCKCVCNTKEMARDPDSLLSNSLARKTALL